MMPATIRGNFQLRPLIEEDAVPLFHLIERNRVRLKDFFPSTTAQITSMETSRKYLAEKMEEIQKKEFFCFVIEDAGKTLQGLFFLKNVDWRVPKCELAYFIDEQWQEKGL